MTTFNTAMDSLLYLKETSNEQYARRGYAHVIEYIEACELSLPQIVDVLENHRVNNPHWPTYCSALFTAIGLIKSIDTYGIPLDDYEDPEEAPFGDRWLEISQKLDSEYAVWVNGLEVIVETRYLDVAKAVFKQRVEEGTDDEIALLRRGDSHTVDYYGYVSENPDADCDEPTLWEDPEIDWDTMMAPLYEKNEHPAWQAYHDSFEPGYYGRDY